MTARILLADDDKEHVLDIATRLGANRTLTKPVDKKTLLTTVKEVLTS